MTDHISPIACDMTALESWKRPQHLATIREVFQAVQVINELPHGFAFRLPNETAVLMGVAEFISNERLCCPFFGFGVEIEAEGGPLWLRLTGREGVKPFIVAEIGEAIRDEVARAANW